MEESRIQLNVSHLDIEMVTCLEHALAEGVNYFNKDYRLLFTGAWNFEYFTDVTKKLGFGQLISTNKQDVSKYLKYEGLTLETIKYDKFDGLGSYIKKEISQSRPVVIYIDSYWCPWNEAYNKYHIVHYCLIIGFDEGSENFICRDPYLTKEVKMLPMSDFANGFGECISFREVNTGEEDLPVYELLNDVYSYVAVPRKGSSMVDLIRLFGKDLTEQFNRVFEEIDKYDNPKFSDLLAKLTFIGWGRMKMVDLLLYLRDNTKIFISNDIIDNFKALGGLWASLRGVLFRQIIIRSNNWNFNEVYDLLNKIADFEQQMIIEIKYLCDYKI